MKHPLRTTLALAAALGAAAAQANTLYVAASGNDYNPGTQAAPYQTIAQAIYYAKGGDTILVGPGTYSGRYNTNLNFAGKDLVLRSTGGAAQTIIDGSGVNRPALVFQNDYARSTVVDGFTVRNVSNDGSYWSMGGGVLVAFGSPTIRNVVFRSCRTTTIGGGGAIYINAGAPAISNCTFEGCSASDGGGAITSVSPAMVPVANCTFHGNSATDGGAAMVRQGGKLAFEGCAFRENRASYRGGAIYGEHGDLSVSRSSFLGNASGSGGAVYYYFSNSASFTSSTFVGNSATQGGAMCAWFSSSKMTQCTVTDNRADFFFGGLDVYSGSMVVTDGIVYGNHDNKGDQQISSRSANTSVGWSDVQGGWADTGDFDADPRFVVAPGADPAYPYGDLHLQAGSPCRSRGVATSNPPADLDGLPRPSGFQVDPNGLPRPSGLMVDLGAYQMQSNSRFLGNPFVRYTITNANSGLALQSGLFSNTTLVQEPPTGSVDQQWDIVPAGAPGEYAIHNRGTGNYLDVAEGRLNNGAPVGTYGYNGAANQLWALADQGNGTYKLVNLLSGKLLEVPGASMSTSNIDQQSDKGGDNRHQQWVVAAVAG